MILNGLMNRGGVGFLVVILFLYICPAWADESTNFIVWQEALEEEALARGISQTTLDKSLKGIELIPRIIELDNHQPEFALSLEDYLKIVASETCIQEGREKWLEHQTLLTRISQKYGVQPRFLVALWGVETRYGQLNGRYPVISALATLAYQGRRKAFFRKELFEVLRLIDQGHLAPEDLTGSWAGALGQFQFMPSSIRRFGVDYDGDGRIDLAKAHADAFASAANYLAKCGWKRDQTWGQEVRLPESFNRKWVGLGRKKSISQWRLMGIRAINGNPWPNTPNLKASLIVAQGANGPAYLVYPNYRTLLKWNRSHLFGLAVGILSDRLNGDLSISSKEKVQSASGGSRLMANQSLFSCSFIRTPY
jgi:membrane-bound lytic murein transglycosylase B